MLNLSFNYTAIIVILILWYWFQLLVDNSGLLWQLVDTSHRCGPPEIKLSAKNVTETE